MKTITGRPDYSPREQQLLFGAWDGALKGTKWQTNEEPPRPVTILGRSGIDPDIQVLNIEGEDKPYWLMASGNKLSDGKLVGTDIWIRETV